MSKQAGHVLASIEGALGDWETSADAMRWTTDPEVLASDKAGKPAAAGEAFAAIAAAGEAFGRALTAWAEQMRPVFEALGEIASRPEVRAMIEGARAKQAPPEPRSCHCFCGVTHPAVKGICDGEGIAERRCVTETMGPVVVPLCVSCATAVNAVSAAPGEGGT